MNPSQPVSMRDSALEFHEVQRFRQGWLWGIILGVCSLEIGIFGFGIDSELNDNLNLVIGFRFTYGFTDLTEPQKKYTADYKDTHSITAGFVVGVAYILNFFHSYH